ncbi:hypothetical protein [Salininema proteolyticum]|uniref:Uncharacterized protein n=1 Tax=Salininema proteolyticum TaxID=1607685 RepID=A0ABV8U4D5_9ACTN
MDDDSSNTQSSTADPDSEFTQAESILEMEKIASDIASELPDFPGFGTRSWSDTGECEPGAGLVQMEIAYDFPEGTWESDLVQKQYLDVLRGYFDENGYQITWDEPSKSGKFHNLQADKGDFNVWYAVGGAAGFRFQSKCVTESDELTYVPPVGDVPEDQDAVSKWFPEGIPSDTPSE